MFSEIPHFFKIYEQKNYVISKLCCPWLKKKHCQNIVIELVPVSKFAYHRRSYGILLREGLIKFPLYTRWSSLLEINYMLYIIVRGVLFLLFRDMV